MLDLLYRHFTAPLSRYLVNWAWWWIWRWWKKALGGKKRKRKRIHKHLQSEKTSPCVVHTHTHKQSRLKIKDVAHSPTHPHTHLHTQVGLLMIQLMVIITVFRGCGKLRYLTWAPSVYPPVRVFETCIWPVMIIKTTHKTLFPKKALVRSLLFSYVYVCLRPSLIDCSPSTAWLGGWGHVDNFSYVLY